MSLIAGEDKASGTTKDRNFNYRFRYPHGPEGYMAQRGFTIKKFERDYHTQTKRPNPLEDIVNIIAGTDFGSIETNKTGADIEYEFLDAFPLSINSMPVSYESSQLLKCTVNFAFTRYTINRVNVKGRDQTLGIPLPLDQRPIPNIRGLLDPTNIRTIA